MEIFLPNSAFIGNVETFLRGFWDDDENFLNISFHQKWISVHPVILSLTASLADYVITKGGKISVEQCNAKSLPYLVRMKLFDFLSVNPDCGITEHDSSGRFIPLTQIKTNEDLQTFIREMIPLLHAEPEQATPIKYTVSELVRNALEHSYSQSGAFVCAQYFKKTNRVSIGIADSGIGIKESISFSHKVDSDANAIELALRPGITGTTSKIGGTATNAGAGLFFIKSIAKTSRNFFLIYSGDAIFKLKKTPQKQKVKLFADPKADNRTFWEGVPKFPGTAVGIDITSVKSHAFNDLLNSIRDVYRIDIKKQHKSLYKRPIFI